MVDKAVSKSNRKYDSQVSYEHYLEDKIDKLKKDNANLRGIIFDIFHEGHGLTIPVAITMRMVKALKGFEVK